MNKDNAKDYLPLVQALIDGKMIQRRTTDGEWVDSLALHEGEPASRYRIKPEPREWWQVVTPKGSVWATYCLETFAKNCAESTGYQVVHVREVLPP